jgi:hypothetical protein
MDNIPQTPEPVQPPTIISAPFRPRADACGNPLDENDDVPFAGFDENDDVPFDAELADDSA